jgi:hypothetical protein
MNIIAIEASLSGIEYFLRGILKHIQTCYLNLDHAFHSFETHVQVPAMPVYLFTVLNPLL